MKFKELLEKSKIMIGSQEYSDRNEVISIETLGSWAVQVLIDDIYYDSSWSFEEIVKNMPLDSQGSIYLEIAVSCLGKEEVKKRLSQSKEGDNQ